MNLISSVRRGIQLGNGGGGWEKERRWRPAPAHLFGKLRAGSFRSEREKGRAPSVSRHGYLISPGHIRGTAPWCNGGAISAAVPKPLFGTPLRECLCFSRRAAAWDRTGRTLWRPLRDRHGSCNKWRTWGSSSPACPRQKRRRPTCRENAPRL